MGKSLHTKTEAQSNLRLRLSSNVSAGILEAGPYGSAQHRQLKPDYH
jgi:hypothetical protein